MLGKTSRTIGALTAMGLVVAGVAATSLPASGQTVPEATQPVFAPYGTLTINLTDRVGTYTLDLAGDVTNPVPEPILASQPCAAVLAGTGNLLRLIPNPASATKDADTVQIRDSAVGVNTGNTSCGSSAAAVIARNEQLKIELGPAIPASVYVKAASLRVTQLKRGDLQVRLDDRTMGSPITISQSPQTVPIATPINTTADLFRSITLQSTSTRDNEGLSVFNGTSFELVTLDPNFEVAVNCGEKVTQTATAGIATKAVFFRGLNAIKPGIVQPACSDVGASVEIRTSGATYPAGAVFWDNSQIGVDGSQQAVRGTITIDWAPVADPAKLDRQIDYDGDGLAAGFVPTLWCVSFASPTDGVLPLYPGAAQTVARPANAPGAVYIDGSWRVPWCLVSDTRVLQGSTIKQTEVLFGSGDPLRK